MSASALPSAGLLRAVSVAVADGRMIAMLRRPSWRGSGQSRQVGAPYLFICFLALLTYMMFGWFSRSRASPRAVATTARSTLLPLGHELVHLFRGDVLRLLLRRAVLCAGHHDADAGGLRPQAVPVAGLRPGWPHNGPAGIVEAFQTIGPFWLPTINTALLLTSGVTLTVSHHASRTTIGSAIVWLDDRTVLLGVLFLGVQV